MPGPLPKDATIKVRKPRKSTRALLPAESRPVVTPPKLPAHPAKEKWHALVVKFWADVWRSPMSNEYLEADVHGLFRMAVLTQAFITHPTVQVSAELRQLSMSYGLSPIDRRRLEWTVAKTAEAVEGVERTRAKRGRVINNDPREALNK